MGETEGVIRDLIDKTHENVLKLIEVFRSGTTLMLVTEFCQNGTLINYLQKTLFKLTEVDIKNIFKQLITGLQFLHENNISHQNIRMDNIYIDNAKTVKIGYMPFVKPTDRGNQAQEFSKDIIQAGVCLYQMIYGKQPFISGMENG